MLLSFAVWHGSDFLGVPSQIPFDVFAWYKKSQ